LKRVRCEHPDKQFVLGQEDNDGFFGYGVGQRLGLHNPDLRRSAPRALAVYPAGQGSSGTPVQATGWVAFLPPALWR
jgi:hypothetical protein